MWVAVSPGSKPSGRSCPLQAANASVLMSAERSVPRTVNVPGVHSRSSSEHSSWWAARVRALAMIFSPAWWMAMPPTAMLRLP